MNSFSRLRKYINPNLNCWIVFEKAGNTQYVSQLESAGGTIVTTPTKLSELTELSQFPAYYVESDMLTN